MPESNPNDQMPQGRKNASEFGRGFYLVIGHWDLIRGFGIRNSDFRPGRF
jgi:hypothetical protein